MENRDLLPVNLLILILILALTGCADALVTQPGPASSDGIIDPESTPSGGDPGQLSPQPESSPGPKIPELKLTQTLPVGLERVQPTESYPIVGEVPDKILDEIIADLRKRSGAYLQDIEVIRSEAVVWNDGSLGCPKPGEFYIQMLINGFWVVLEVENTAYDYRVSDTGYFTLCEGGGPLSISTPGDPYTGISPDQ